MLIYVCYIGQNLNDILDNPDNLLGEIGNKFWPEQGYEILCRLIQSNSKLVTHPKTYIIDQTGKKYTVESFIDFVTRINGNK